MVIRIRLLIVGCSLAIAMASCGSGELSLTEYASEVEGLVAGMVSGFASIDAEWLSEPPTVERAAEYWEDRLEIRNDFLEAIKDLNPPEDVEAMHAQSIDIFTRITQADVALRAKAESYSEFESHWQWVDTPEGRASDALLEDVYAFCRDSQEEFDETQGRDALTEMPWIPSEMKEVVRVAFGCPPSN